MHNFSSNSSPPSPPPIKKSEEGSVPVPTHLTVQTPMGPGQTNNESEVLLANALFPSDEYPLKQRYVADAQTYFRAYVQTVDYQQSGEVMETINRWAAEKTHNLIRNMTPFTRGYHDGAIMSSVTFQMWWSRPELLVADKAIFRATKMAEPPHELRGVMDMIIISVAYFKGEFTKVFRPAKLKPFFVSDNVVKKVPIMKGRFNTFYEDLVDLEARAIEIPYKGRTHNLLILLPYDIEGLSNLEDKMVGIDLSEIHLQNHLEVKVWLPKIELFTKTRVLDILGKV
uniref:Serpin domain-containing protein n=1 Tax=Timema cristinae TaxID=61476 RepID=A0A7R9GT16_TIMCR|nr:unnamed protein product [Timema cristinae]